MLAMGTLRELAERALLAPALGRALAGVMPPVHNPARLRSALLVDAENMSQGLANIDRAAMVAFRTEPGRWLKWLRRQTYSGLARDFERNFLVRDCFLNPMSEKASRRPFAEAGFRIVDCPVLAMNGKNSADIHLVVTAMDLLTRTARFDEVVIMSSDSDYVPLLHHLRAQDRRTVVVTAGPHSRALAGACDHLITGVTFAEMLLADEEAEIVSRKTVPSTGAIAVRTPAPEETAGSTYPAAEQSAQSMAPAKKATAKKATAKKATAKKTSVVKATVAAGPAVRKTATATRVPAAKKSAVATKKAAAKKAALAEKSAVTKKAAAKKVAARKSPAKKSVAEPAMGEAPAVDPVLVHEAVGSVNLAPGILRDHPARDEVLRVIVGAVRRSQKPVNLATLGGPVRQALGAESGPTYAGARSLKKFMALIEPELAGVVLSNEGPGYLYDPDRHDAPMPVIG